MYLCRVKFGWDFYSVGEECRVGCLFGCYGMVVGGYFVVVVSILYNFDYINTDGIGINNQQFVGWIFN